MGRAIAFPNDREKDLSPAPRARRGVSREESPISQMKVVAPSGAGRGVLGLRSRFTTALQFRFPAPKSECDARPNLGAELPLLLGAAALALGVPFPQRVPLGFPPPRPIDLCLIRPQSYLCLALSGAGRGLRCVRLAVDVCFAFLTDFPRGRGRRGRRSRPKPSAALFRLSKLAEKLPRSVFRLRRASPPIQ